MVITQLSIINAIIVSNILIVFFIALANRKKILENISLKLFGLIALLFCIRIIVPIELPFTTEVESFSAIPLIIDFLNIEIALFNFNLLIQHLLLFIWVSGVVFVGLRKLYSYVFLVEQFKCLNDVCTQHQLEILNKVKSKNNYKFKTRLIVNDAVPTIMEFGFIRQTILIPEYTFSDDELTFILSHELNHFANKTNWIKLLLAILNTIMWWNPLMYLFTKACDDLLEIYCDYGVTKNLSLYSKKQYLMCLLNYINLHKKHNSKHELVSYLTLNHSVFKTRVELVLEHKKNRKTEKYIVFGSFLVFLLSYGIIVQPAYEPPIEPSIETDLILNDDNYQVLFENGTYVLYYDNEPYMSFSNISELKTVGIENFGE